ncbi:FAD-binding protein [Kibdelosporangium philippinense]|uniref:FAD-binding protein n=1 Tax=Kibdelosporangium philippinense TaxID=211113 RepID=A0ABS8ZA35_9PSEU|nr:NAD(P)-binding protein [Kibdelosporangium philippinense]MCE7004741.1 FAD-binding protein [Kibdelosporangium philippinense]
MTSRRNLLAATGGAAALSMLGAGEAVAAPKVDADAIVVGGGLAGLVATSELAAARRRVLLLDQERWYRRQPGTGAAQLACAPR